jgi:prolyl-tRNA synthetase
MGLRVVPMRAETGPIGGDQSHEFIILAETGESAVFCDAGVLELPIPAENIDYDSDLSPVVKQWTSLYAATEDVHDEARFARETPEERRIRTRGIEVGQVFFFGDKYSRPMHAVVTGQDGVERPFQGGSYGVGVSRLVGALIEANHDEAGIIWPEAVAPFKVGLANLKGGDAATDAACGRINKALEKAGVDVLYDDTDERPGAKFAKLDLIGLPYQVIVGPKGLSEGKVEVKARATGAREQLSLDEAILRLTAA